MLTIIGLILNLVGTIVLAFSTKPIQGLLNLVSQTYATMVDVYKKNGAIVLVDGIDKHANRMTKEVRVFFVIGIIFLIVGQVLLILGEIID